MVTTTVEADSGHLGTLTNHQLNIRLRADVFFMDKTYIELTFQVKSAAESDLLTGVLATLGFEGFLEEDETLRACIESEAYDEGWLAQVLPAECPTPSVRTIREENWNARWESSFEPVVIPGRLSVRASFHAPVPDVSQEIIITPKMSFGTGHHATTSLMLEEMLDINFQDLNVLDFGTGTGVLAILAELSGAQTVHALDNDPWSMENARENMEVNQCTRLELSLSEKLPDHQSYDVILANINRNVLLEHADQLISMLRPGGRLLLSGLLVEDRAVIEDAFSQGLKHPPSYRTRNGWILLSYVTHIA